MADPVTPRQKRANGAPPKTVSAIRTIERGSSFNEEEDERMQWAAREVGLPIGAFMRMASLKFAKEILG